MGKVIAILLQACCRYEEGDQLMEGGVYWNADEEGDELLECLRMNEEDIRDKEYNWTRFERYKMYQHDIRDQRRHRWRGVVWGRGSMPVPSVLSGAHRPWVPSLIPPALFGAHRPWVHGVGDTS